MLVQIQPAFWAALSVFITIDPGDEDVAITELVEELMTTEHITTSNLMMIVNEEADSNEHGFLSQRKRSTRCAAAKLEIGRKNGLSYHARALSYSLFMTS